MNPQKVERVYDNKLTYTGYFPGVEKNIKALYEEMYPGHIFSEKRFFWRWQDNYCLQNQMVNIWDGDILVAHETTNASLFMNHGQQEIWGLSGTTIALPNYPGMKVLLTYKRNELCPKILHCIGFPNNNMYRIARDLNENEDLGGIPYLIFNLNSKRKQVNSNIARISEFSEDYCLLDEVLKNECSFYVVHSREYLNWRLINKPDSGYEVYEYRKGSQLLGYIAINTYMSDDMLQGQIIDVLALEDSVFLELIEFANGLFIEKGCSCSKMWMTAKRYKELLLSIGAQKTEERFHLISTLKGLNLDDSYITMATSDVF